MADYDWSIQFMAVFTWTSSDTSLTTSPQVTDNNSGLIHAPAPRQNQQHLRCFPTWYKYSVCWLIISSNTSVCINICVYTIQKAQMSPSIGQEQHLHLQVIWASPAGFLNNFKKHLEASFFLPMTVIFKTACCQDWYQ